MRSIISYSDKADQELYLQKNFQKDTKITVATIAGNADKPNEDAFELTDEKEIFFAGIFDGTTSLKPINALGEQTGARFASHFLKEKFVQADINDTPKKLLLKLNRQLLDKSLQFEDAKLEDTHTLPSSTGTIIKIDNEKNILSFAHVGDSIGIIYLNNSHSQLLTDDKNGKFDNKMFSLIAQISKEKRITPKEARHTEQFKKALIEMFITRNNNPNGKGSGVINGDPQVEQYIQKGTISLQGIQAILLGTDGLIPIGWSERNEQDRQKLLNEIRTGGFQKLFKIKKASEDADPDWHHIRYKHSDDATGVLIEL